MDSGHKKKNLCKIRKPEGGSRHQSKCNISWASNVYLDLNIKNFHLMFYAILFVQKKSLRKNIFTEQPARFNLI